MKMTIQKEMEGLNGCERVLLFCAANNMLFGSLAFNLPPLYRSFKSLPHNYLAPDSTSSGINQSALLFQPIMVPSGRRTVFVSLNNDVSDQV